MSICNSVRREELILSIYGVQGEVADVVRARSSVLTRGGATTPCHLGCYKDNVLPPRQRHHERFNLTICARLFTFRSLGLYLLTDHRQ